MLLEKKCGSFCWVITPGTVHTKKEKVCRKGKREYTLSQPPTQTLAIFNIAKRIFSSYVSVY